MYQGSGYPPWRGCVLGRPAPPVDVGVVVLMVLFIGYMASNQYGQAQDWTAKACLYKPYKALQDFIRP